MFGLSVSKIVLLALIVGAIVVGTRVLGRIGQDREAARRRTAAPGEGPEDRSEEGQTKGQGGEPVDLVACQKCGTFFSPGKAVDCGRAGCPYAA